MKCARLFGAPDEALGFDGGYRERCQPGATNINWVQGSTLALYNVGLLQLAAVGKVAVVGLAFAFQPGVEAGGYACSYCGA